MTWRVLIADDHPLFRHGVVAAVRALPGWTVVAEAGDGTEAISAIHRHRPDVAIVDVSMPDVDGLEVLEQAQTWSYDTEFVMLTMHDEYVARALGTGALGYLLKEDAVGELEPCLLAVVEGARYVSERLRGAELESGVASPGLDRLSPAERRVLRLVAQHRTSREVAALIHVSLRTVQNHRANMVRKLGLRGSSALLRYALEHKDELDRS